MKKRPWGAFTVQRKIFPEKESPRAKHHSTIFKESGKRGRGGGKVNLRNVRGEGGARRRR